MPSNAKDIEDIYPLSPMQEGLLFHSLYAPDSGVYVAQHSWTLKNLNVEAFGRAWERMLERHQILRTAFIWKSVSRPLQVVFKHIELPLATYDWRHLPVGEQEVKLREHLILDRVKPFKLNVAPLMRLALIHLPEDDCYFIWTQHHILVDGWCLSILLKEAMMFYEAFTQGRQLDLDQPPPYRNYVAWVERQESSKAEAFWRHALKGFTSPTALRVESQGAKRAEPGTSYSEKQIILSPQLTGDLQRAAREQQLTLNTLVLGAWALLLSHHSGQPDVAFGTTVSGRPSELAGVESMVGLFINVLPMRAQIRRDLFTREWLAGLQSQQAAMREQGYCPLAQVQQWSDVPRGRPLFETLLSFENYPVEKGLARMSESLEIKGQRYDGRNNYKLTLLAIPGEGLLLRVAYDDSCFAADVIGELLNDLAKLLSAFVSQPDATLGRVLEELMASSHKQPLLDQKNLKQSSFNRLKASKPKPVTLPRKRLVEAALFGAAQTLPLVIRPAVEGVDLADWAGSNREFIEQNLLRHGALLFRGFGNGSAAYFDQFVSAICPEVFGEYGDLPREELGGRIYGSTPFPSEQAILFHNEGSHLTRWPLKIWFSCLKAPREGGETPLVDCRRVYQIIDPKIREQFARKGLMYVRNYVDGLDIDWQTFFRTSEPSVVEAHCKKEGIEFEWTANNGLRTRNRCAGVATHPKTGEPTFFNQVQLHHIACLDAGVRESLLSLFEEQGLPRHVFYGDGSPIEDAVIEEICATYQQVASRFKWDEGDILMLDNMLTAHGRDPYKGDRKVVVAMGEMMIDRGL